MSAGVPSPVGARPRHDLPWLRRRALRPAAPAAPAGPAARASSPDRSASASAGSTSLDLSAPAAAGSTSLDLSAPASRPSAASSPDLARPASPAPTTSTSLDLSAPAVPTAPAAPAARPAASTSLDLSTPAPAPTTARAGSTSLDLSTSRTAAAPDVASPAARRRPSAAAGDLVLGYTPDRLPPGGRVALTDDRPTLALDRLQSGVGALTFRAAVSEHVGDLRLAAAYRLTSGESSVLDHGRGLSTAPVRSNRPVVLAAREATDVLRVDLRQVGLLERLVVLAFSPSGAVLPWGGALLVETAGGGRVDVALDREPDTGVLVALSVTNVAGELVLRSEDELVHGTFRDACLAYGFTQVTWVDPWTPLT